MQKTMTRKNGHIKLAKTPIYRDVEKLKKSLLRSTAGMKHYAGDLIAKSLRDAKAKSKKANRKLSQYTHRKPYSSLGLAAVAGACIGFIVTKIIS